MAFLTRLIRMARDNKASFPSAGVLSDLEKTGDGCAIAAEHVFLGIDEERQKIDLPRASSLHDACMRLHVLATLSTAIQIEKTGIQERVIFGMGNAIHSWIQNTPDILGNNRYGWWRCIGCATDTFGGPPTKPCRKCKAKSSALVYREHHIRIKRDDLALSGHPDIYIKPLQASPGSPLRVVDIKSIDKDAFKDLAAPLAKHEWQVLCYLYAHQQPESKFPVEVDPDIGYILYVSKGTAKGSLPVKMFPVVRTDTIMKPILEKLHGYVLGVKNYPQDLPDPIRECQNSGFSGYRANQCPCRDECRSLTGLTFV